MSVRGPILRPKRILIGVGCINFYNSSLGAFLNHGPVMGLPIVSKRRMKTIVRTINGSIPSSLGPNVDIAIGPCAGYNGYTSYHGNEMGTYRRGRALKIRHGKTVYRCVTLP